MKTYRVYLAHCPDYDGEAIARIIGQATGKISLPRPPGGRVVIKPNLVMAHPKVATEGYTRSQVVEGIVRWLNTQGGISHPIHIVEKSGLGITTATAFRHAGYRDIARRHGVRLWAMEENPQSTVTLEKGRLHKYVRIAQPLAERDFLIFAPKLKTNVLSDAYSGALKLNIGSVDSKERMFHHDRDLPTKIVDLLEIANPDLIVSDGIRFSFGGNQMTQSGIPLGVLVVSTNAVAHDIVCAQLLHLDPLKIEHIREAIERGYGPRSLDEIEILGDISFESLQKKTEHLDYGFYPVDQFRSNFRIITGKPYCTGGCQGIFLDWLHMIKDRKPKMLRRFPRLTAVVGKVDHLVKADTVLLVGNCARASRQIEARRIVHIKGCPPTHKRLVWDMMTRFFLLAPLVRPSLIWDGFGLYPLKKLKGWWVNRGRHSLQPSAGGESDA